MKYSLRLPLLCLSLLEILLLATGAGISWYGASIMAGRYPAGPIELPSGYSSNDQFQSANDDPSQCVILRSTDRGCKVCRLDQRPWLAFGDSARARGCKIFLIAGTAASAQSDGSAPTLVYLPPRWLESVTIRANPTTLIVAADRRIAWHHMGALDDDTVSRANLALKKIGIPSVR